MLASTIIIITASNGQAGNKSLMMITHAQHRRSIAQSIACAVCCDVASRPFVAIPET